MNSPLRPFQVEAISKISNHHVVLVAPTGSGKSRIFQEFLLQNPSARAVLVSPLNSLSQQHFQQLSELLKSKNRKVSWYQAGGEKPKFDGPEVCILSPEKLSGWIQGGARGIRERMVSWRPNFLIVDEAHCVWEWGLSFRPQFKALLNFATDFKIPSSFWCTATLPIAAKRELQERLPHPTHFLGEFQLPPRLKICVKKVRPAQRVEQLHRYVAAQKNQLGIVFVNTRLMAERLAFALQRTGIQTNVYHAGFSSEERRIIENRVKSQESGILFATSAFGMGMNLPQVRHVLCLQPPTSLLALMQAWGRATRDLNAEASGEVWWDESDFLSGPWADFSGLQRSERDRVREWCEGFNFSKHPDLDLKHYFS